jgi:hypothetical protein
MAAWAQVKELFPRLDRELDAWEDDDGRLYRWREETA